MKSGWQVATLAIWFFTAAESNAEFAFRAEGATKAFNKAAKALKLETQFDDGGCQDGVKRACNSNSGPLAVVISSNGKGKPATELAAIYVPDGKQLTAMKVFISWGALISAMDPSLSGKDVGNVLKVLTGMIESGSSEKRMFGDVTYSISKSALTGVILVAVSTK